MKLFANRPTTLNEAQEVQLARLRDFFTAKENFAAPAHATALSSVAKRITGARYVLLPRNDATTHKAGGDDIVDDGRSPAALLGDFRRDKGLWTLGTENSPNVVRNASFVPDMLTPSSKVSVEFAINEPGECRKLKKTIAATRSA